MVVDAALAHTLKRQADRVEVSRLAGALAGAPQEFKQHRLREFRRATHTAMHRIDHAADLLRSAIELGGAHRDTSLRPRRHCKPAHQGGAVLLDVGWLLAEDARHIRQHVHEGWLAEAADLRKI